jgi:hypothetical protein
MNLGPMISTYLSALALAYAQLTILVALRVIPCPEGF